MAKSPKKVDTKKLSSPFKKLRNNFAIDPNDGRLKPSQAERVKEYQWVKGGPSPNPGGRPKTKLISDDLKKRISEISIKHGKPLFEIINETLLSGALGETRISPSQMAALQMILNYTEGKPAQFDEESGNRPMIVMDLNVNVQK